MDSARLERIRSLFEVIEKGVYFNHAATSPLPSTAVEAVCEYARRAARDGRVPWPEAEAVVEKTRLQLAELLHVAPETVAFTRNTSSGVVIGLSSIDWQEGDNVVLMKDAFPAVTYPFNFILPDVEKRWVTSASLAGGPECVFELVDGNTRCIALPWVHFLTGSRFDVASIARFCRERGIFFIVDAIQGIGAVDCDWSAVGADFVAGGGPKWLLSPQGTGYLHVRADTLKRLKPTNHGWLSARWESFNEISTPKPLSPEARRFEEGTKNYLGIFGMHESLKLFLETGMPEVETRLREITGHLRNRLEATGWEIVTPAERERSAGTVTCRHAEIDAAGVVEWLADGGMVCAVRENMLRIAPHFYNTEDEVDRFLAVSYTHLRAHET